MVLVGRQSPDFVAAAVLGDGTIVENYTFSVARRNKYTVLFFWPLDFTFVCPSEIIAFNNRLQEFKKRNVEIIGLSVDSHYTHLAWRNTPVDKGGIGPVGFTMVSDLSHNVAKAYGIETPDGTVAYRASFLIDRGGVVRHQLVNDLPLGRDIDEMLRMVDALQFYEEHGEVCPAGWQKGEQAIHATPEGVAEFLSRQAEKL